MVNQFVSRMLLVVVGSLCLTFATTRQLEESIFWSLLVIGLLLNIVGIIALYWKFQKLDQVTTSKKQ